MSQVINPKNKYFIGFALVMIAIFTLVEGDYYVMAALLCISVSVFTTFDKDDPKLKNPKLWQTLNLSGYVLGLVIWLYSIYFK